MSRTDGGGGGGASSSFMSRSHLVASSRERIHINPNPTAAPNPAKRENRDRIFIAGGDDLCCVDVKLVQQTRWRSDKDDAAAGSRAHSPLSLTSAVRIGFPHPY